MFFAAMKFLLISDLYRARFAKRVSRLRESSKQIIRASHYAKRARGRDSAPRKVSRSVSRSNILETRSKKMYSFRWTVLYIPYFNFFHPQSNTRCWLHQSWILSVLFDFTMSNIRGYNSTMY
jgi:hypothetical protein